MEKSLGEKRKEICLKCPIFASKYGGQCSDKLYLNPTTNESSTSKSEGFIRGCGCILEYKWDKISSVCPAGKW